MRTRTVHPKPQRWALVAAWAAFWVTVPSAVWRILMIVGLMPGTGDLRQFELADNAALAYAYVFGLSIVQVAAGFLTVGLVRPWGERFRGRRVPVVLVLIIAALGGLAVVWLFDVSLLSAIAAGQRPDDGRVSGLPLTVMVACYVPVFLWGPLELVATVGYWLRRRRTAP